MNVIVTGCSRGIGLELVKILSVNHKVYAISRDISFMDNIGDKANSSNIIPLSFDLLTITKAEFDKVISSQSVDVLINNAGCLINKEFMNLSELDYRQMMDVNFYAPLKMIQFALDKLSNCNGQVLNIGSIGGVQGSSKFPGLSVYSSSKGALAILTECLAVELSEANVNINCLALGAVQTEMLNQAFPGYKAEISANQMAQYVVNFIQNGSSLSNGLIIPVKKSNP